MKDMSDDSLTSRKSDRLVEGRRQERAALRGMGLRQAGEDEVPRLDLQPAFHPETPKEYQERMKKHHLHHSSSDFTK